MPPDVTDDFAAAGGVANVDGTLQVEDVDKFRKIIGVGVQIISIPRLTRPAVATAVMRNAAESVGGEKHHLVFKSVGA